MGNIILVTRQGASADNESQIKIQQGRNTWIVSPRGDISRDMCGYTVSQTCSIIDFLNGLHDAGFQVIVRREFADETPNVFEHTRCGGITNGACYVYGLAFGLNKWSDILTQMRQFKKTHKFRKNPYFNNEMRILKETGMYYAGNPWQARFSGRITLSI